MKKIILCCAGVVILAGIFTAPAQNSFAIGFWHEGIVTKAPWIDKYTYIQIDNVRYTIMKNASIVKVYKKKGALYKDGISVHSIQARHRLIYKSEGNRIYEIEKIR